MANQRRIFKVAQRIRELVAEELNRVADPRFHLVTITSAVVSPDMRHAKVYWMVSGQKERIPEVEEAFLSAEGLFRRILAKGLGIRYTPVVKFYYDDTLDAVEKVEELLSRIQTGVKD